jgi:hypothetical protein
MRTVWLTTLVLLAPFVACRGCAPNLVQLQPGKLVVEATQLQFPPTYVGSSATQTLQVTNTGQAKRAFEAQGAGDPFSTPVTAFELAGGASTKVAVDFTPLQPGQAQSTLLVGEFVIQLQGEGLAVPECLAPAPCQRARFDVEVAACVATTRGNGEACTTTCLAAGQCVNGVCVGQASDCDDHDACTVDACGETGCVHPAVTCPAPQGPCQQTTCEAKTGCGVQPALDGTLCGVDDCTATRVDVCINGSCVNRPRPETGRCANTWVTPFVPARGGHALAYDAARQRVVLFGGSFLADT